MGADILSDKELSSLIKLAAAALESPDNITDAERYALIEDLDQVSRALDERRGVL